MARYLTHPSARSLLVGGVLAGILGGCLIDAFLFAVGMARFPATFQWIASGILGPAAYASSNSIWIGIALHFAIAIVAAIAYGYAAQIAGLLGRPVMGGIIFGVVMNAMMDLIAYAKRIAPLPSGAHGIGIGLVAHVIFFGIPIAWFLSRYERVLVPY